MRVQLYYYDMGAYHKHCIQHMEPDEFKEFQYLSRWKAFELTEDDWYGKKLPNRIIETI